MKITKQRLIELIKEEIEAGKDAPPPKKEGDVQRIIPLLKNINNAKEFQQLLEIILDFQGINMTIKRKVMLALRSKIIALMQGKEEV
tara:strand:+ start:1535 stop:1795 length:261 start_codon:yes stop_codon:yes gene_type:complete